MRGAVLYGPRDVRLEEREAPKIIEPTDAIIRLPATCVCGSDLWDYRGIDPFTSCNVSMSIVTLSSAVTAWKCGRP